MKYYNYQFEMNESGDAVDVASCPKYEISRNLILENWQMGNIRHGIFAKSCKQQAKIINKTTRRRFQRINKKYC